MKIKFWILAVTLALTAITDAATNDLTGLLQKGLFDEEANRDLNAAIADYQSVANAFDKDRQLAATAIFRLGECYRKLGKDNEAAVQYQRIIKEFSDQPTLVNLSRQNLAGMGGAPPPVATSNPVLSEPARQLEWIKKLQAMPLGEVRQIAPTVLTDATLINLIYQYNQTELDLIRLRADHGEEHPEVQKEKTIQSALRDKIKERLNGMFQALSMEVGISSTPSITSNGAAQEAGTTDEEQTQIRNIEVMIRNSPDLINAPGGEGVGKTPLIDAAEKGQLVVAKYLLDHGADVNGLSRNHGTVPLIAAAANGHKAMVELLLARGADVSGGGLNPLYEAVSKGYLAVAEVLIANKADVNARSGTDSNGMRPVHIAARDGRAEILQMLLQHGADVNVTDDQARNPRGYTPLELAAMQDEIGTVKILIAAKANVEARDKSRETPVEAAIRSGGDKVDMVSLLLEAGASADDTNQDHATPLTLAVQNGAVNTVRVLLAHKADPNRLGSLVVDSNYGKYLPVFLALSHPDILKLLLDAGGKPEGMLSTAIDKGSVESVRLLLEHGADPRRLGPNGVPPLAQVVSNSKSKGAVPLLLDKGADPNVRWNDSENRTPLFLTQDPEVGRWLIAHKADVNARNKSGQTPLMTVLWNTNYTEMLLAAGSEIDLQDTNGNTALHHATISSFSDMVAVLLAHKANPNIQNEVGSTPLDLAKNGSSGQMERRLWIAGGDGTFGVNADHEKKIVDLLIQAGGLAELPKRNRIEVRRASNPGVTLLKGLHDWNRYSLLEIIANSYGLISSDISGEWRYTQNIRQKLFNAQFRFPDFKNVVIYRRTNASAKQTAINVDVEDILKTGDCSRDVSLEWGDVVEVPEADHPLDQKWPGLSVQEVTALTNCVSRRVTLRIKGEDTFLTLAPRLIQTSMMTGDGYEWILTRASFMLRSVLDNSKLIRVSSDLSRVKVTRLDPQTKKQQEWVIDCTDPSQADLWLHDGDVVEVPEK